MAPTLYLDEISDHFERLFNVRSPEEHVVLHELASRTVHIDVHVLKPTEERPYYVLFTTGMSDLPMTMHEDTPWDVKKIHERAELFCLLPPDWNIESPDEKDYWPIRLLRSSARFPHEYKTILGHGHTICYSNPPEPYAEGTELCSTVFIHSDDSDFEGRYGEDFGYLQTEDNTYIKFLALVPVYLEELNFVKDNGSNAFFERIFGDTLSDIKQLIIDPQRENFCFEKVF